MKTESAFFVVDFANKSTASTSQFIDRESASEQEAQDRAFRDLWKRHGPMAVTQHGWAMVDTRYVCPGDAEWSAK